MLTVRSGDWSREALMLRAYSVAAEDMTMTLKTAQNTAYTNVSSILIQHLLRYGISFFQHSGNLIGPKYM